MGASKLCVAMELDDVEPLVAARGFVFGLSYYRYNLDSTTCSWEGPRLAPRANLGVYAAYAAGLALRDGSPSFRLSSRPAALVAMRTSYSVKRGDTFQTRYEVRLFAMGEDGHMEHLDTVEPGFEWVGLFHPSGRFLYLSQHAWYATSPGTLVVYSIDPEGHLVIVQTLENRGGAMAVTLPPEVRASASAR